MPSFRNKRPEELSEIVGRIRVFARVAPRQKLQIVEAARQAGHFVAVTGDGVNDAPALRVANIGVAMGKSGTDVAREAAELVISDDNFATIVGGIEEGRVAYDNIRKVIYLLVSTGAAELVLMALAIATGTPYLPLLPVQILWLNLVTNGIQDVALAFEPNEGGVLQRKPRSPRERIFNQLMIERTVVAAMVMGVVGFLTFRWFLPDGASEAEVASARNCTAVVDGAIREHSHWQLSVRNQVGPGVVAISKSDLADRYDHGIPDSPGGNAHAVRSDVAGCGADHAEELGNLVAVGTYDLSGNGTAQMDLEYAET